MIRALTLAALAALIACGGPDRPAVPAAERRVVEAYAETIKELSFEGGRILQEEVKPRITDLRDGSVTVEQFQREAENWIRLYEDLGKRFDDVERVPRLDAAAALYRQAMATYADAFRAFLAASKRPTRQERNDAITAAVPTAEKADDIFDRARAELERVMRQAGLDPASL